MMIHIDADNLCRTACDLVAIDSVNPRLAPGAGGEAEIAAYVARALGDLGLEVSVHEPEPGRPSVVGRLPGSGGGRSLMLNAHYDTVGVEGMENPFEPILRGRRLYGRGAYDMKGSLAACLAAARALVRAPVELGGDLLVAAVADEEYASLGTRDLIDRYSVNGAIVTEPTGLDVCLAHRGFTWLEVETLGRAAHGSRFREGVDANLRMGRVLAKLEELERELRARPGHPLLGPPSLHAATLRGGTGISTYAARCRLEVERRTVPGESEAQVERELREILEALECEDPTFEASLRVLFSREPFETSRQAPVVRAVRAAARHVLKREPKLVGESPWMDSALLAAAGMDTVVIGPSGGGAHAAEEWVELESVRRLAEILAHAALDYCG
ncbi:MAG: ArgE/DapE family deacylase [Gemmatimonadota bacterium]